jgi:hypothetical protein
MMQAGVRARASPTTDVPSANSFTSNPAPTSSDASDSRAVGSSSTMKTS